ncbi:MAG: LacI family DNA-binding transcriptional regulator [Spirochaetales bacterium]|nr:LacI family DNA-binding transcriptional regulator [Spirochaetales bacterium]
MAVTIHDVAKKAGVSHTTVSWVIHDDPRITQETKAKVWAAIKELNYHPNYLARSLVSGKTETIAVVAAFFSSFFELDVLRGIEMELENLETQYNIILYSTRARLEKRDEILNSIVYGRRSDAIILLSLKPSQELSVAAKENGIPIVLVEEYMENTHVVKTDNYKGAFIATEHLIKAGKKTIGLISGTLDFEAGGLSQDDRLAGYKAALEKYGLEFKKERIATITHYYMEEGIEAVKKIYTQDKATDGIFCSAGDMVAIGAIKGCRELGIQIPSDLAIIGYDDIVLSSVTNPALTTVRQPLFDMGKKALEIAVGASQKKEMENVVTIFEPEVIERESV